VHEAAGACGAHRRVVAERAVAAAAHGTGQRTRRTHRHTQRSHGTRSSAAATGEASDGACACWAAAAAETAAEVAAAVLLVCHAAPATRSAAGTAGQRAGRR
jgi:hypothetical protein